MEGKVIRSMGGWYEVRGDDDARYMCRLRGKLRLMHQKVTNPVVVGDGVVFDLKGEEGMISSILPRKNYITRQVPKRKMYAHIVAANIDQVILMASFVAPRTTLGTVDRFLVGAEFFHMDAVLVWNKIDLLTVAQKESLARIRRVYEGIGYRTLALSALKHDNINGVTGLLGGKTSLLIGLSGVGKSTLVNVLAPTIKQKTGELCKPSQKGRHTTTYGAMFSIESDTFIIDTPGMKGLVPHGLEKKYLGYYFPEMRSRLKDCQFYNCTHRHEPGCAVIAGLERGEVALSRYKSYVYMWNVYDDAC